jgi:FkbM family methyltransferase
MTDNTVIIKEQTVDGIGPWFWPAIDTKAQDGGLWQGPADEWGGVKRMIQTHVTDFGTVVQAGGASGMYPRLMAEMFDTVYTFEPHSLNFFCLNFNCQKQNIVKIQAALGEYNKMIGLFSPSTNMGMHMVTEMPDGICPMLKIDNFEFKNLGLIYLDIEHSEFGALRGAEQTIIKHKPIIVCENDNMKIDDFLGQFGYSSVDKNVNDTLYKIIK